MLNVGNSANPTNTRAVNISINNNYAYIADSYNGVIIINISDPHNPYIVNDLQWTTYCDLSVY
ncbi:MAG: hypothetical protein H0Z24_09195 [Thermosipho sp. (in: Bacteria)]|nr:hypothetical protein [Thermosipho sp. (in: thermotogales)]